MKAGGPEGAQGTTESYTISPLEGMGIRVMSRLADTGVNSKRGKFGSNSMSQSRDTYMSDRAR